MQQWLLVVKSLTIYLIGALATYLTFREYSYVVYKILCMSLWDDTFTSRCNASMSTCDVFIRSHNSGQRSSPYWALAWWQLGGSRIICLPNATYTAVTLILEQQGSNSSFVYRTLHLLRPLWILEQQGSDSHHCLCSHWTRKLILVQKYAEDGFASLSAPQFS